MSVCSFWDLLQGFESCVPLEGAGFLVYVVLCKQQNGFVQKGILSCSIQQPSFLTGAGCRTHILNSRILCFTLGCFLQQEMEFTLGTAILQK